jgi:hypothetical protein
LRLTKTRLPASEKGSSGVDCRGREMGGVALEVECAVAKVGGLGRSSYGELIQTIKRN